MHDEAIVRMVEEVFRDYLAQRGFELVELVFRYEQGTNILRVLADRPTGGINLQECAGLNRELGQLLEKRQLIKEDYALEVNSPGLDRPLRSERDFARNLGKQIKVFLTEQINGRIEVDGTVSEVSAEEVSLLTRDGCLSLPLSKINKAKLII